MRHALAGFVGGMAFCALFLWLDLHLAIALTGTAVGCGAAWLATAPKPVHVDFDGMRPEVAEALENGRRQVVQILELAGRIPNESVRAEALAIGEIGRGILGDLGKDQEDLPKARRFLDYYLESTRKVLERYVDLSERNLATREAREGLEKVGNLLGEVRKGFEAHRAGLAAEDLLDLDVEMQLLRSTMKTDGGFV
ncbi:MAG: 5-bromo-4-chloroindolyl phosphate hydrolysis family protein [Fibrobacteres bacterium]|nr:5-bromo-4-chloroindolyl phosphate hydrolysis family protein [Fibrobacterota bacterium]